MPSGNSGVAQQICESGCWKFGYCICYMLGTPHYGADNLTLYVLIYQRIYTAEMSEILELI